MAEHEECFDRRDRRHCKTIRTGMNINNEPAPWIYEPGRTLIFQAWLDSLEDRKIRRIRVYLPDALAKQNYRNYASNGKYKKLLSLAVGFSACLGLTGCDSLLDIATAPVAIVSGIH